MEGRGSGFELLTVRAVAVQKLLGKLASEGKSRIRELSDRFVARRLLSSQQRRTALENADDQTVSKKVFADVLLAVSRDEAAFDALVEVLRDEGYEDLASDLLRSVISPSVTTSSPVDHSTDKNSPTRPQRGTSRPGNVSNGASPCLKHGGSIVDNDSGIASRNQTGLLAQLSTSSLPPLQELTLHSVQSASSSSESSHVPSLPATTTSVPSNLENVAPASSTGSDPQLVAPVQVQEPRSFDIEHHPAPIQVAMDEGNPPNDMIVVPDGDRLLSSNSLTDLSDVDLAEDLRNMRQELQQMKAEGMQKDAENTVLQDRCKELQDKVEQTTVDLEIQRELRVSDLKEKEDVIKEWKQRYEDKAQEVEKLAQEVEKLRNEIAAKEREKDDIVKEHEETISELNNQHKKTVKNHTDRIQSLQKELNEMKERKNQAEIDLAKAEGEVCRAEMQKAQAEMLKAQEELRLNKAMHKLELETMELRAALSQTKETLARERKATCERELCNQRRHSVKIEKSFQQQLQNKDDEIKELKQTVKRLVSQTSSTSSGKESPPMN